MVKGEYISEIYKWYNEKALNVNRRYQRKLVWTLEEKQQFIDTIINNYPVPLFILVNTEKETIGGKPPKKEIIDGLQRLEAIVSFILNKFPVIIDGQEQYFDLSVYPGNSILLANKKLHQGTPIMDAELSHDFLLYQLPISSIDAGEAVVDDVFKRINSTGRKLSPQDLRQAGVVSNFSNLVRIIATHLRGDATEDIISLNEIADYSLSSPGLDYGLETGKVFWIEQGIITEEALRRSKDEELIALLCNCILSDYKCGMTVDALNRLYNSDSVTYKENEKILTVCKCEEIIDLFRMVISDMLKIFKASNSTFGELLFSYRKNYNKDIVFIIVFIVFAQLYSENYFVKDYDRIGSVLHNIADNELDCIISKSNCVWNAEVRQHLVERIKSIVKKYMVFQENNPEWNSTFMNFLRQIRIETQMCDFKIGLHDLRTGVYNSDVLSKCVKTLVAMANTKPNCEGVIVLGVSDKASDAADFERFYGTQVQKYNEYYISGVNAEASKFYGSIQNYTRSIKEAIESEPVTPEIIQYILCNMDVMQYGERVLIVLKLKTAKPVFYDREMYVRYESHNKHLEVASREFYSVLDNFNKVGTLSQSSQTAGDILDRIETY